MSDFPTLKDIGNIGSAMRFNADKPQLHYALVFKRANEAVAHTLQYGAGKYEYLNFARGGKPDQEFYDAAMRHMTAAAQVLVDGDESHLYDDESGCMHIAHAIFNLQMLIEYQRTHLPLTNNEETGG